ncbi:MAG: hypothetical protein ACLTST_05435 [Lachnospiraceae bacterium]
MRSCAYKTVIAVAVLKKPVFWGNLNVRLVFLLVVRGSDMRYMNSFFDLTSKLMWEKKKIKKTIILKQVRRVYRRISIEYFLWETEDIRFN